MLGNSLSRSGQRITIAMLAMLTLLALPPTAMAAKTKLIVSRGTEVGHDLVEARFMELNPDIEITVNIQKTGVATQLSAGGEGLLVQLAGGMIPDVAVVADATFGLVAAHGGVEDLTARVVAGDYLKTTWPAAWDAVRLYGRYWGIPYVTDTRAMLYNTEVLAGGGIGHRPTTLEELDAIAHKLTAADSDGKYHQFGFWPFAGNWTLFGWGWLFGGEFVDSTGNAITANDPAVVRALEYEVGYGRRYSWSAAAYPSGLNLCAGNVAMEIRGSWNMASLPQSCPNLTYDATPVPPPASGRSTSWSGIWVWVIPEGAPNREAAWRYLEFLMTPEAQRIKALSLAQIPTNRKALAAVAPELVNLYGAPARTFLAVTEFTRARPVLPITNEYWNAIAQARAAAYKMQMTPQAALDDVRKQMQALLDSALQGK